MGPSEDTTQAEYNPEADRRLVGGNTATKRMQSPLEQAAQELSELASAYERHLEQLAVKLQPLMTSADTAEAREPDDRPPRSGSSPAVNGLYETAERFRRTLRGVKHLLRQVEV